MIQDFNRFLHWSTAALLYTICFFIRVSPNTLQEVLQTDLSLSFGQIGLVSAIYYYTYGLSQMLGSLSVHYIGIQRYLRFCLLFLIAGLCLFIFSTSLTELLLSRFLMGIGASILFFYTLQLAEKMLPHYRFSFFVALTNLMGILGALCAQTPLEYALSLYHWRYIFSLILAVSLLLIPFILEQESYFETSQATEASYTHVKNDLLSLWNERVFFGLSALIALCMMMPLLIIPEMWGSLFLEKVYGLSSLTSSYILSFFFIGVAAGSVAQLLCNLEQWFYAHLSRIVLFEFISVTLFLYLPFVSTHILCFLGFTTGAIASSMLIFFSLLKKRLAHNILVVPFFNMILIIIGSFFQPLIGIFFDILKDRIGLEMSCVLGLSLVPLCMILGHFLSTILCKHTQEA